jgi:MFS superfamily sulfate permease-like transporter
MTKQKGETFTYSLREVSGAIADLGTLLPLTLSAIVVAGLAPAPVFAGFAIFYLATALYYRLPIPVQLMKVVAAVLLTAQLSPAALAVSGVMLGGILLVLGATGWITQIARLMPKSVLAGLQLGLGAALALVSLNLMASAPVLGLVICALLLGLSWIPGSPAALIALAAAIAFGQIFNLPGVHLEPAMPGPVAVQGLPSFKEIEQALSLYVLPQLPLTLSNAVLLTALIAGDYFGERAAHVTPGRLSMTSGLANLLLTPFGALPMCHGAGGLAAHYRFGARSGAAPLMLGFVLLVIALMPGNAGVAMIAAIPAAGLGALLLMAAAELAMTRRVFDSKPSCWPVIAVTACVTVLRDPFWGLLAGSLAELVRAGTLRLMQRDAKS